MPNSKQATKRLRQAVTRNLRNRKVKSEIKTFTKKVLIALEGGDASSALKLLEKAHSKLDRAAKLGVLHRNTVNRRKSLLSRKVAAIS